MKSQKKKNKKTKKLRSLVLILFLTIIMFGTSTYAWFTANRVVRIESIDVHVETSDGLQISTNGTTWKSVITTDDIKNGAYSGANNFIPDSLDAVSTNGEAISDSEAGTRLLHNNYLTESGCYYYGKTLQAVQTKFCPSGTWVNLVYGRMQQLLA